MCPNRSKEKHSIKPTCSDGSMCFLHLQNDLIGKKPWEVVSSYHITLIEANVCVCVCGHVCVLEEQLCLRERTSDKATGPSAANSREKYRHETAEGKSQKKEILPCPLLLLKHCIHQILTFGHSMCVKTH